jgi:hypothetical protein
MSTAVMPTAAAGDAAATPPPSPERRRQALPRDRFQVGARRLYAAMGWLLAAAATILASSGQLEFARVAGINDLRQFLVPAILEIAVIFVLLGGYLRACDGESPALMWALAIVITSFATWTNLTHGGPRAGRIFAAATVLTFVLWLLHLRDRYRAARRAAGLLDAPTAKFRLIRWIVMPSLTTRAWLIAVEYGLRDAEEALRRARLWRDTATDTREQTDGGRWQRRRVARRAATLAIRAAHHTPPAATPPPVVEAPPSGTTPTPQLTIELPTVAADPVTASDPTPPAQAPPAGTGADERADPTAAEEQAIPETTPEPNAADAGGEEVGEPPTPQAETTPIYVPISDEDATMYQAWLTAIADGREATGADLARAAGRDNDTAGVGRKAARRYRDAHADDGDPPTWQHNGHRTPAGAAA